MIFDSANYHNSYGKTILQEMSISPDFLKWSIELSRSGLFGKLIEISCGLGNNLDDLNEQCTDLWASDYNEEYLKTVASEKTYLSGTILWDIEKPPDFEIQFDSFFCSNVLEHIEDDENAMCNIAKIPNIKKGVIIVPANNHIYSRIDKNLGHYRRYDKKMLLNKLAGAGFKVLEMNSFNKIGTLGWIVQSIILKRDTLGSRNMRVFDKLMPLIRRIDSFVPFPGLSLLAIVKKTS